MPSFTYRAVDPAGRRNRGTLEAGTADELRRGLTDRGLLLLSCEAGAADERTKSGGRSSLVETTRALASLLGAGLTLTRALDTARVVSRGPIASALGKARARVERGETLSAALAERPDLFDAFYIGAIRAGEHGSDLATAVARLADHVERKESIRQRLLSASIYPMILAAVGGSALIVLLLFVVPRFVVLIEDAGATVPAATRALVVVSALLRQYWLVLLVSPALVAAVFGVARSSSDGRRVLDRVVLALPVVGPLFREVLAARFARLLGLLLRGGLPLLQALDGVAASIASSAAADAVAHARARVREGQPLNVALGETGFFPELLPRLIAVGEESGRLADFLERAAAMLEDRSQRATERAVTLLEPAMIVAFGGVVALVALSLLQAVYGLNAMPVR